MSKINVSVTDGTNVNLTVSPRPVQTITVSRGSTGGGGGSGTVTQVTANTPLSVTNGTTTPDLSIAQATTSTAGYVSSTDWNTFNNKIDTITSSDNSITVTGTTTKDLVVNHTQNVFVYVRNATEATLTKGTVVYITGAIGQTPTISKAQANSDATSAQTLGVLTVDLANNTNGYITIIGFVEDVNTSAYADGQQLYLSPTVAGGMTATKPQAPQHLVYVAIVEYAHAIHGKLFVKVQNGYELDELHDVQIISPTNGQTITYDSATSLWKNTTPTSGGVTSVTATSPVASTGGATPVISLPAATTSTSGYLTSTDWNTFNSKGSGTVTGTGTANYLSKFTSSTAIGNSVIFDNGTNVGIGTSSPGYLLDVQSTSTSATYYAGKLYSEANVSGVSATYLRFEKGTGYGGAIGGYISQGVGSGLVLATVAAGTFTDQMWVTNAGNVGIGTASPTTKLDVNGTTRFGATGADTITLRGQVSANSSVGTSGQVLTSQGVNLPPQWTTPTSGSGTVTSVTASTTPVSGLYLSGGTITSSGTIGIAGTLNLSAPPAIGGTTPNTITGTTLTANTEIDLPAVVNTGLTTGRLRMVDGSDGYDYLSIDTWDGSNSNVVYFPGGINVTGTIGGPGTNFTGKDALFVGDQSTYSGSIALRGYGLLNDITIQAPALATIYTLTLPTSAGSNNQVLKTDGTGVTSWVNLNAPSIYTTASSQNSTSATLANITGLTATLAANTTYRVDCFVTFQSAATTTGINFGFTSPTGTTCMLEVVVPITNTAAASQLRTIFPNNSSTNAGSVLGTGVSTINSNHTARFSGIIKVGGTGGTFAAQYATEVAASAITIPAGSTMVIQQIS